MGTDQQQPPLARFAGPRRTALIACLSVAIVGGSVGLVVWRDHAEKAAAERWRLQDEASRRRIDQAQKRYDEGERQRQAELDKVERGIRGN